MLGRAPRTAIALSRVTLLLALTTVASSAQQKASAARRAMDAYFANRLDSAVALFTIAAQEHPDDAGIYAWLAEAALRTGNTAQALSSANKALRLQPCNAHAHLTRASLFMPRFVPAAQVSDDSAWAHLITAVKCDASDGNAWAYVWKYALMRGDTAMETRALRAMVRSGYLTRPLLTYARWQLESLPPRAILLTAGDMDTYAPLAVQAASHIRRDVAIVNIVMLNAAWYSRPVLARHDLRYDAASDPDSSRSPSQRIIAWLKRSVGDGSLGRPLAFAITTSAGTNPPADQLVLQGPYWRFVPSSVTSANHELIAESLRRADQLSWRGPAVAASERSPMLRTQPHAALIAARVPLLEIAGAGKGDEQLARHRAEWVAGFLRRAGIDSSTIRETLSAFRD